MGVISETFEFFFFVMTGGLKNKLEYTDIDNEGYLVEDDERINIDIPGFIAEDWEEKMPIAVNHDKEGRPENWNILIVVPLMFQMIKDNHKKIESLEQKIA